MQFLASFLSVPESKVCGLSKFWQSVIRLHVVRVTIFDLKLTQCSVEMLVVLGVFSNKLSLQKSILRVICTLIALKLLNCAMTIP